MNVIFKILRFAWKNRTWLIPAVSESYQLIKRWNKKRLNKKSSKQYDKIQNNN